MKPVYRCRVCGCFTEESVHCGVSAELVLDGYRRVRLSKLMAFLLRHCPQCVGLEMDRGGWVSIEELARAIRERWRNRDEYSWVEPLHILAVALTDPKGRYEVRDGFIRARYGHNAELRVSIDYDVDKTSRTLFHGTSSRFLESILREGIKPMKRAYVHLSTSVRDACLVGSRHGGNPVVLVIDANCVRMHGFEIMIASHSVRVTKFVPRECIVEVRECWY